MATNTNQQTVGVKFTLKGKYDTSDTVTLWLTNKPILGEKASTAPHFPVLRSVRNLGVEQNLHFPKFRGGEILLDSGRDSLAFEKRIIDLSRLYVLQGAIAEVYVECTDVKDAEFFTDATKIWQGEIQRVRYTSGADRQRLSISIGQEQREHVITKKIRPLEFPEASDQALNKYLPVVFGLNQQVAPYAITEAEYQQPGFVIFEPATIRYAYATTLTGGTATGRFHNGGINKYLAKELRSDDLPGKYYEVESAPTTGVSAAYGWSEVSIATITGLGTPRCFWIPGFFPSVVPSTSYYVHGIIIDLEGNNAGGDPTGELSIRIHRKRNNLQRPEPPSISIAEAVVDKSEHPEWSGSGSFSVAAQFDRPVPIVGEDDETYWVSIQGSNESDAASVTHLPIASIQFLSGVPVGLVTHWKAPDDAGADDNDDTWQEVLDYGKAGQTSMNMGLYAFHFADTPEGDGSYDEQGLGYSYFDVSFNGLGQTRPSQVALEVPDIDRLDLILEMDGLEDVDGGVTGVPGFILGNPLTQVEMLFHTFDGTDWLPGNFDNTRFTTSHDQYITVGDSLFRETAGRTYNKTTNIQLIQEIARNSYSKVAYDGIGANVGNYSILAPGRRRDPVVTISDLDAEVESWFVNDLDTVVNAIDMNYARRLDTVDIEDLRDQEDIRDYSQTLYVHFRDGGLGQTYGAISAEHYGERRPTNENYDFISGTKSANSVAELTLRLQDHPFEYAQIIVPYCKYSTLKMYDVVRLNSTEIPSPWGTAPEVFRTDECGPANGYQAKTGSVRGEIVAMTLNLLQDGPLLLRLLIRLVTQINDPLYNIRGQT